MSAADHGATDIRHANKLSDNSAAHRKPGCFNRSRSALSQPVIVRDGYKENGAVRHRAIRTNWNDGDRGLCQYAKTDEGRADRGCVGCLWRVG